METFIVSLHVESPRSLDEFRDAYDWHEVPLNHCDSVRSAYIEAEEGHKERMVREATIRLSDAVTAKKAQLARDKI